MAQAAKIPVIDISAEGEDQIKVAKGLVEAAVEHGFIYIKNTGGDIPVEAIEDAFSLSKTIFHETPYEEKKRCEYRQDNRGWCGIQHEILDPRNQRVGDYKEVFNFGEFKDGKAQQPLPSTLVGARERRISAFFDLCYEMTLKLNTLFGIGLGIDPPEFFRAAHHRSRGKNGNILRFLYYPPLTLCPDADAAEDVRAGAHSDYGSLTLLFRLRGQAGLEIQTRTPDGSGGVAHGWAPVPVVPPGTESDPAPPVLVNIGDLLSYWTNGLLRSTVHRVVFPAPGRPTVAGEGEGEGGAGPRYSIAYFCHPADETRLTAVPSERVRGHVPVSDEESERIGGNPYARTTAITADDHLQMRLRRTHLPEVYGGEGEAS